MGRLKHGREAVARKSIVQHARHRKRRNLAIDPPNRSLGQWGLERGIANLIRDIMWRISCRRHLHTLMKSAERTVRPDHIHRIKPSSRRHDRGACHSLVLVCGTEAKVVARVGVSYIQVVHLDRWRVQHGPMHGAVSHIPLPKTTSSRSQQT